MKKVKDRQYNKETSLVALILCLLSFVGVSYIQSRDLNVRRIHGDLIASKKIIEIPKWSATFLSCSDAGSCTELNRKPIHITFPGSTTLPAILKDLPGPADRVRISAKLSEDQKAWFQSLRSERATLIFPYMVHQGTQILLPADGTIQVGRFADIRFPLSSQSLSMGSLELQLFISPGANWFGPALVAPALVEPGSDRDFLDISPKQVFSAHMNRLLEVVVPLLFAAMALILDHALVAGLLSLFAALRALRCLAYLAWETEALNTNVLEALIFPLHGMGALAIVFVVLAFANIEVKRKVQFFSLVGAALLGLLSARLGLALLNSDLVWDAILAVLGMVTTATLFLRFKPEKKLELGVVFILLALFLSTNLEQYLAQDTSALKSFFDWRNQILVPGLVFIAFIDIGSIYNTIQKVSSIVRQKAELDKEIEISKAIQFSSLPESKAKSGNWTWHGVYRPASKLAGDWYDVREIEISPTKTVLVAAMVDVTGHGISAAMMTSNIASHWSLWTRGIPKASQDFESYLALAPQRVHEGLIGLRSNLGCSMAAMIFDQTTGSLYYTTAGHPGILTGSDSQFRYHSTEGSRPGSASDHPQWTAKTTLLDPLETMIVLYTDGIVPPGSAASQWLGRIKQELRRGKRGLLSQIGAQIIANSRTYRKNLELEDDLTFLLLKKEPAPTQISSS